jgi:hypothetical protein
MKKTTERESIVITTMQEAAIECYLVGRSPLIINRLAEKARQELLLPRGRLTTAEKQGRQKHEPIKEFRSSAHKIDDDKAPTYLAIPASAPKRALASAALDMPGAKKAQIGRLTYITGELIGIYGRPELFMAVTRSADMNRTPDIRTRCIVKDWAAKVRINYVTPILKPEMVMSLLTAAGIYIGVGDWRSEKGSGNYGQFNVMDNSEATVKKIKHILAIGREEQIKAMEEATPYNSETAELLEWYKTESPKRGFSKKKVEGDVEDVEIEEGAETEEPVAV